MKEKLLCDWKLKYERVQWELQDNEKKLENVIKRQKNLSSDILVPIVMAVISYSLLYCLWEFRDNVMFLFHYFYLAAVVGLSVAALVYNGYRFIRAVKRYIWHMRKWDSIEYPKPETVRSNYPTHIPSNYYAERVCIEWLLHQYTQTAAHLIALRHKIENTPEQNLEPLRQELDSIVIYERVGRAPL